MIVQEMIAGHNAHNNDVENGARKRYFQGRHQQLRTNVANRRAVKLSEVRRVASLQCTQREAAAFFSMSASKWSKLLKSDDRVKAAWEEGRERGKVSLRRKQMDLATTNAQMAIHLGKQYLDQTDSKSVELTGRGGGPIESMDLGKLSADERKQLRHLITQSRPDSEAAG